MANEDEAVPSEVFFQFSEAGNGPWEIGRPQSVITQLVAQGIFQGEVLDIGCGIADNAIYIATNAKHVHLTGVDLVPKTIEIAREKAKKSNINIQFEVVDMLDDLSKTNILKQHSYDIILDAALFHMFSNVDRQRYIKNLEYLIKPGGLYIQLCFSENETREGGPRHIKKSDLNQLFSAANGWTFESIEDAIYETKPEFSLGPIGQAYLSIIRRNKNNNT